MENFDIKIKVSFKSQNLKKSVSSPLSILLIILNKTFQFELHPHIGEIRTKILVYDKGGVIKHIKAPARVNAELPGLWKNRMRDNEK